MNISIFSTSTKKDRDYKFRILFDSIYKSDSINISYLHLLRYGLLTIPSKILFTYIDVAVGLLDEKENVSSPEKVDHEDLANRISAITLLTRFDNGETEKKFELDKKGEGIVYSSDIKDPDNEILEKNIPILSLGKNERIVATLGATLEHPTNSALFSCVHNCCYNPLMNCNIVTEDKNAKKWSLPLTFFEKNILGRKLTEKSDKKDLQLFANYFYMDEGKYAISLSNKKILYLDIMPMKNKYIFEFETDKSKGLEIFSEVIFCSNFILRDLLNSVK